MELFTESSLPAPARPTVIPRLWHLRTPRGPAWTSSVGMPRVSSVWIANQWSSYPMVYQLVNYQPIWIPRLWHLPNDQIIGLNKSRQKVQLQRWKIDVAGPDDPFWQPWRAYIREVQEDCLWMLQESGKKKPRKTIFGDGDNGVPMINQWKTRNPMGHQWKIMENQLTLIENHWLPDCPWEGGWDHRAGRYYVWWWSMWIPLKPGRGSLFHTFSTYLLGRTFGNNCCLSVSVSPIHLGCVFTVALYLWRLQCELRLFSLVCLKMINPKTKRTGPHLQRHGRVALDELGSARLPLPGGFGDGIDVFFGKKLSFM